MSIVLYVVLYWPTSTPAESLGYWVVALQAFCFPKCDFWEASRGPQKIFYARYRSPYFPAPHKLYAVIRPLKKCMGFILCFIHSIFQLVALFLWQNGFLSYRTEAHAPVPYCDEYRSGGSLEEERGYSGRGAKFIYWIYLQLKASVEQPVKYTHL